MRKYYRAKKGQPRRPYQRKPFSRYFNEDGDEDLEDFLSYGTGAVGSSKSDTPTDTSK
jgi:hypothetical protein